MKSFQLKELGAVHKYILIFLVYFSTVLFGQDNTFIYHSPPEDAQVGKELIFSARVNEPSRVRNGILYYRAVGNYSYQEIDMNRSGIEFIGVIPGINLTPEGIEYVIVLQEQSGNTIAYPNIEPFENPQFLPVKAAPGRAQRKQITFGTPKLDEMDTDILILNPGSGEVLYTDNVVIAASYFFMEDVDSATIRITVDDKDVTSKTEVGEGIINYIAKDLTPGLHTIKISMKNDLGVPYKPFSWSFTIGEARFNVQDFVEYNGSLNSQVSSETVGGSGLSVAEISGKFNSNFKWLSMRSRFRLTTRESEYLQPYNRLTADFYLGDYLTIKLGDVNPNLSSFLIDGQRIRGLDLTLAFNYIEFKMVRGEVNRPVQSLGSIDRGYFLLNNTSVDSSGNLVYELDRRGYTFRRSLDAYRLSLKWKNKFWLGLQVLKGIDDINSLDKIIGNNEKFTVQEDSLISGIAGGTYTYPEFINAVDEINGQVKFKDNEWGGNDPVDNVVAGFHFGTALDDKRLKFEFSWNFSMYNRNIWNGAMTKAEMDTALDDTLDGNIGTQYDEDGKVVEGSTLATLDAIPDPTNYESIFTINAFMTPLVPIDALSLQESPMATIVNMPSSAFNLKLSGHYYLNNFTMEYRQVGPEYVTLGNPYLSKNIREFVATNRVSLLDRKLSLTFSYNHRDNKILKNPTNPLTTNTLAIGISLMPGPDAPSFTFNIQSIGKDNEREEKFENIGGINVDKREEYRTINSLVSVNFPFVTRGIKSNFVLNYNEIKNTDLLIDDRASGYVFPKMDMQSFSSSLTSQPFGSLRTVLNYSRSESAILVYEGPTALQVPMIWVSYGLSGQYAMLGNKLRILSGISILSSEGILDHSIYALRGGAEYTIFDGFIASVSGNIQANRQQSEYDLTNSGVIASLRYRF